MQQVNFLLVGVGGQGTLLASNILAQVGLWAGYDVKKSEVHGMAQRGGSVSSHVRWGKRVFSPLTGAGQVDILVAFERVEALRYIDALRPEGKVIINDHAIIPMTVTAGDANYPEKNVIWDAIKQATSDITIVPGMSIADELGNARVNNIVILGVLSRWLDVDTEIWHKIIAENVPTRYIELNLKAFSKGQTF